MGYTSYLSYPLLTPPYRRRRQPRISNRRMAALIAEQMAAIIPTIVVQVQQVLNAHVSTNQIEEAEAEPSSPDNNYQRSETNHDYVIPAIPLNQVAPNPVPDRKPYRGHFPQCPTYQKHHPANTLCRLCTYCGLYGHLIDTCRHYNPQTEPPMAPFNVQHKTTPFDQPNTHLMIQPYVQPYAPLIDQLTVLYGIQLVPYD